METVLKDGFYSGVSLMPLLPYISDTGQQLELMFKTLKKAVPGMFSRLPLPCLEKTAPIANPWCCALLKNITRI